MERSVLVKSSSKYKGWREEVGVLPVRTLWAAVKGLDFVTLSKESHWKTVSRGVKRSDLCFKMITLPVVEKMKCVVGIQPKGEQGDLSEGSSSGPGEN